MLVGRQTHCSKDAPLLPALRRVLEAQAVQVQARVLGHGLQAHLLGEDRTGDEHHHARLCREKLWCLARPHLLQRLDGVGANAQPDPPLLPLPEDALVLQVDVLQRLCAPVAEADRVPVVRLLARQHALPPAHAVQAWERRRERQGVRGRPTGGVGKASHNTGLGLVSRVQPGWARQRQPALLRHRQGGSTPGLGAASRRGGAAGDGTGGGGAESWRARTLHAKRDRRGRLRGHSQGHAPERVCQRPGRKVGAPAAHSLWQKQSVSATPLLKTTPGLVRVSPARPAAPSTRAAPWRAAKRPGDGSQLVQRPPRLRRGTLPLVGSRVRVWKDTMRCGLPAAECSPRCPRASPAPCARLTPPAALVRTAPQQAPDRRPARGHLPAAQGRCGA